jgi:hypothetical protein
LENRSNLLLVIEVQWGMVSHKFSAFEIREVPDPEGGLILELRANGLRLATARATADIIASMGMGRDDVRRLFESSLSDLPLKPELEHQVFGYWFGPGEPIPPAPVGAPTGAVLPRQIATMKDAELICLDLVPVHNYWLVLSELGRYTYRHTSGLLSGEEWRFVPVADAVGSWPIVFVASFDDSIAPTGIEKHYGFEASTRARLDAPVVQLHLMRQS